MKSRVLVLEDIPQTQVTTSRLVRAAGGVPLVAATLEACCASLNKYACKAALIDLELHRLVRGDRSGEHLIPELKKRDPFTWASIYTGIGELPDAVRALKVLGADWCLHKSKDSPEDRISVIQQALSKHWQEPGPPTAMQLMSTLTPQGEQPDQWMERARSILIPEARTVNAAATILSNAFNGIWPVLPFATVTGQVMQPNRPALFQVWSRYWGLPLLVVIGKADVLIDLEKIASQTGNIYGIPIAPSSYVEDEHAEKLPDSVRFEPRGDFSVLRVRTLATINSFTLLYKSMGPN